MYNIDFQYVRIYLRVIQLGACLKYKFVNYYRLIVCIIEFFPRSIMEFIDFYFNYLVD